MEKALTYTIMVGDFTCPNRCKICISYTTPDYGLRDRSPTDINWRRFDEATQIVLNHEAKNVMFSGKGAPDAFPGLLTQYLIRLYNKPLDKRELQSDGSILAKGGTINQFFAPWRDLGLNYIALSIYHYDPQKNKEVFQPKNGRYFDLPRLIEKLKKNDFNVRLSCCLLKGYIDNAEEVKKLIEFSKTHGVDQLSLRRTDIPKHPLDSELARKVVEYTKKHRIDYHDPEFKEIHQFIRDHGSLEDILPFGALIYEVKDIDEVHGQNVAITTGLSLNIEEKEIKKMMAKDQVRNLIWFPQGWLTTSWENVQGGRLL